MSKQIEPHVLQLYEPKKLLGSGAYGHVWKVVDKKTKETMALKKIFDAFQNSTDAQRTYRQISLLHQMQHRNIVKLHRVIKSNNKRDLYLVFQYMESDLHSLVGQSILTASHMCFILYQILKALKYMHSAQLIHRDLKPSNVLINSECQVKICDFGLARSLVHEQNEENILSQEVATRWYRSPEMLLSSNQYGKPTDVWSVGCIVAELLMGEPIFPGTSTLNQLQKIVQFTGMPSRESIQSLKSEVSQSILSNVTVKKRSLKQYFRKCDQQCTNLIQLTIKMLQFNPDKRPTIEQILQHKMFSQFQQHNNQQEQICQKFIIHQVDDNTKLTLQQYRKIIYQDIQRRYPQFVCEGEKGKTVSVKEGNGRDNKKHRSLMEKNKKKEQYLNKNHSFICKSLPKTTDHSNNSSGKDKKNQLKKQHMKQNSVNPQISADYIKSKFYKSSNNQHHKQIQSDNLPVYNSNQQMMQVSRYNNFIVGDSDQSQNYLKEQANKERDRVNEENQPELINMVKKKVKGKKQVKENNHKQISPPKKSTIEQQEKALVYKNQLKRLNSTKNLVKTTKMLKPKFDKNPPTSAKVVK